jgi:hypothetical protein
MLGLVYAGAFVLYQLHVAYCYVLLLFFNLIHFFEILDVIYLYSYVKLLFIFILCILLYV